MEETGRDKRKKYKSQQNVGTGERKVSKGDKGRTSEGREDRMRLGMRGRKGVREGPRRMERERKTKRNGDS